MFLLSGELGNWSTLRSPEIAFWSQQRYCFLAHLMTKSLVQWKAKTDVMQTMMIFFLSFMTLFQKDFLIGMMRSMDYCRSWKYVFLKMPQVTATKLPMVGVIKLHISWCLVKLVCLWGSGYACFAPTLQQSHSCFCLMAWWLNGWHYLIEHINKALVFQYTV